MHPSRPYTPRKADLNDLLAFEHRLNIAHVCLIAFSVYATDNTCLLDSLARLQGKGRAVVAIDPATVTVPELERMHRLGVRGVRLNLKTESREVDQDMFGALLRKYADLTRPFGWVLQLYISLEQVAMVADEIRGLGVKVVIDHLGAPDGESGTPGREQRGYKELLELLESGRCWVKLSGTYRFAGMPDLEGYVREILRRAPTQLVWASDWPHSGGVQRNPGGDRMKVQEYREADVPKFVALCKKWCDHDERLIRWIWVDNPRKLWDYNEDD